MGGINYPKEGEKWCKVEALVGSVSKDFLNLKTIKPQYQPS